MHGTRLHTPRLALAALLLLSANAGAAPFVVGGASPAAQNVAAPAESAPATYVRRLGPGEGDERALAGGDSHHYQIEMEAGQYAGLRIEYQGVNGFVTFRGPGGEALGDANLEAREYGVETVSLVSARGGLHTVVLEPDFKKSPPGRYRVSLEGPRAATDEDRRRFAAQQSFVEATALVKQESADAKAEALKKLAEALEFWRGAGDRAWESRVVFWQAWTNYTLGRYPEALERLTPALELRRASGDVDGEAEVLRTVGIVHTFMEQHPKALEYFNLALGLQKGSRERWQLAATFNMLGHNALRQGDAGRAADHLTRALRLMREVGDDENEAGTLTNLSAVHRRQGDYQSALDNLHRSLELFRELGRVHGEATTLNVLGLVRFNLGEREKALEHFALSVSRNRDIKEVLGEAFALTNLATTHSEMGDKEVALRRFDEALALMRRSKNIRGEAMVLLNMGKTHYETGDRQKALEKLERAVVLSREAGDKSGEATALTSIGRILSEEGDYEKANERLTGALKLRRGGPDRYDEAVTLSNLAHVEAGRGRLREARAYSREGLDIIESLRARVAGPQPRISYMAANQGYYRQYLDILMRLHEQSPGEGFDAEALHAVERARARALLESLAEARVDIRQGVDRDLVERERTLRRELNAKDEERRRLLGQNSGGDELARSAREIDALLDELQQVRARIRAASPLYAGLPPPRPLDLKGIQAQLDEETLLVVYSLGKGRSFLWAVTPKSLEVHALPGREELERRAGDFYESLKVSDEAARAAEHERHAEGLSRLLLGPVARLLGGRRLVVVADGKLQYVPFAALPSPADGRPLVAGHEVVYLPSVSVLERQRRELSARPPAPKTLAVIADPVFEADDSRLKSRPARNAPAREATPPPVSRKPAADGQDAGRREAEKPGAPPRDDPRAAVRRAARDAGVKEFTRLRSSRREAETIVGLAPPGSTLKLLNFDASRANVEGADLTPYRIVHFATHGLLNEKTPDLSGIVLSQYDREGRPQDGFLRAHELYDLKLGADLVVLSACETALGRDFGGEGFIGLARGLMYAGAPRVVVSLWKVDDVATAELMKRFYRGMLRERLEPAAALRAAQASMAREPRWSAPFYWAGFALQGEWRGRPEARRAAEHFLRRH